MIHTNTGRTEYLSSALQFSGFCPLILVSSSMVTGLVAGMVVMTALLASMLTVSVLRRTIPGSLGLPILLVVTSTVITILWWYIQGYYYALAAVFGVYIPLLALDTAWLARLDAVALRNGPVTTLLDAGGAGLLAMLFLLLTGTLRELIADGGIGLESWKTLSDTFLLATGKLSLHWQGPDLISTPAGAFLLFGTLIAVFNYCLSGTRSGRVFFRG